MKTVPPPLDTEAALFAMMSERNLSRTDAVALILQEWLGEHGYGNAPENTDAEPGRPDREEVQYPGYFDGGTL